MRILTSAQDLPRGSAFVPTMGALHEGHASLIHQAAALARPRGLPCIVSIFVNPTQFNETADFDRYPRTLETDAELCEAAGATHIFAPSVEEVYPKDAPTGVPPLPRVATAPGLEDRLRPGHFAGVCQVVKRLFELAEPRVAVFGEKDWQQLQVITAMTRELKLGVEIVPGATVREPDGLAMSSRNRFLSPADRVRALALSRALCAACGQRGAVNAERVMAEHIGAAGLIAEYAVVRDAQTLISPRAGLAARALIAARLGSVRLIDNCVWPA